MPERRPAALREGGGFDLSRPVSYFFLSITRGSTKKYSPPPIRKISSTLSTPQGAARRATSASTSAESFSALPYLAPMRAAARPLVKATSDGPMMAENLPKMS